MKGHVNHFFAFHLLLFGPSNIMNVVQCSEKWIDFFLKDFSEFHVLYFLILWGSEILIIAHF